MSRSLFSDLEAANVNHNEGDDLVGYLGGDLDNGDTTFESLGIGDFLEDPGTGSDGSSDYDFSLDLLDVEADSQFARSFDQKFSNASEGLISIPRKRRSKGTLENFTVDDFDSDTQKQAFLIVKMHTDNLFSEKQSQEHISDALEFFFADAASLSDDTITFDLCCDVLQARPDIFRLRLQYEWWLRCSLFTGAFPFDNVAMPDFIQGEIMLMGSMLGVYLASEVWAHPSIDSTEIILLADTHYGATYDDVKRTLEMLAAKHLLSLSANRWYVTGRNPQLENNKKNSLYSSTVRGGSYSWSTFFK